MHSLIGRHPADWTRESGMVTVLSVLSACLSACPSACFCPSARLYLFSRPPPPPPPPTPLSLSFSLTLSNNKTVACLSAYLQQNISLFLSKSSSFRFTVTWGEDGDADTAKTTWGRNIGHRTKTVWAKTQQHFSVRLSPIYVWNSVSLMTQVHKSIYSAKRIWKNMKALSRDGNN